MKTVMPKIINLCVVRGKCPARCVHCPVGEIPVNSRKDKFGYGFMNIQDFKQLCLQILEFGNDSLPCLRIHGIGEPALWDSLHEALIFAKDNKIKTWVFTMGLGLDAADFIDTFSNADIVEFSINSVSIEDFKNTKRLGEKDFQEIVGRMEKLAKLTNRPKILLSRVQTKNSEKDAEFINYWQSKKLFDDVFIRSFHDYGERIKDKDGLLSDKIHEIAGKSCLVPSARMNIDGVLKIVVRCFNELFDTPETVLQKSIGFIDNESLADIWYGQKMDDWRQHTFQYEQCSKCRSCQPVNPNTSEKQL